MAEENRSFTDESTNLEPESKNFIENFIDEDLKEGKVKEIKTRFPPEPNGYLHIGHAKSILLNYGIAQEYNGTFNLRFDDTNPVKEKTEFVDSIRKDVEWLGADFENRMFFASDYFPIMYEKAVFLIKKGKAFVDDLTAEEIREYRGDYNTPGKESPCRNRSIEENLRLFTEMKEGKYQDGEKTLRAKIDMASPNINMRDPILYRVSHMSHHNTGDEWCIYPMYDFAHPIEDAVEGISHSLCTLEFEDHRPLYDWVVKECEFPFPPRQIEFARLNITNMLMSKRYLKKLVDEGTVSGWDDPRMPTIAGIRRRGYTPEAIRSFCDDIGVAKSNSTVDFAQLETSVRDDLQFKVAARNVVMNPIKVVITNYPEGQIETCEVENNRNVPELGEREIPFGRELWIDGDDFMEVPVKKYFRLFPGNEVRLKGGYFITCNEVVKNEDGSIKELLCTYDPETKSGTEGGNRKVKGTIHFVEASTAVKIKIREYQTLMIENEDGDLELNPDSLHETWGYAEPSVSDVKAGERFQFFRKGYYIADSELTTDDEKVFNSIVSLKSSWKK